MTSEMFEHILAIKNPSWWKSRSSIEKCLIISTFILFLLLIITLALKFKDGKNGSHDICFTPKCVKTASQVLERADLDVNPCDDFYNFACGSFVKNTFIPRDKSEITSFSQVQEQALEEMRVLLEKPISAATDIKPFILAKSFYQACMNETAIDLTSLEEFKKIIKKAGGWPVLDSTWNETNFNWVSTTYRFMDSGIDTNNVLINFLILNDETNSSYRALFLDQIQVANQQKIRLGFDEPIVQAYYNYIVKIAIAFGGYKPTVLQEMKEAIEFYVELIRVTVLDEDRRNSSLENNPMSFRELQREFPYVPWLGYVNKMTGGFSRKKSLDDIVYVKLPQYYRALGDLLQNTPKRTVANYFFLSVVDSYSSFLNSEIRDYSLEFSKVVTGVEDDLARWMECTNSVVNNHFIVASGALYVRNYFKKETKTRVEEMVKNIQEQFQTTLQTTNWMDNVTIQHALEKMKNMKVLLAFPDELFDDKKLIDYYNKFEINANNYLESICNIFFFAQRLTYSELDKEINRTDWKSHSYAVLPLAQYDITDNSIELVAGILQGVFFNENNPKYMNYGAIGSVIAHEITHGFDDLGRQYDKKGNLNNWWDSETNQAFSNKAQCFIDQQNSFTASQVNLTLNGKNTQGEVIADSGGFKHAYLAYKKWTEENEIEKVLPGLPYSPEQLFWISAANVYCSVQTKENLQFKILNDKHPPEHYRINAGFMNSEFFARDFNCVQGSAMNPATKCEIW